MKVVAIIISLVFIGLLASTAASAQQTQLTQDIKPFECVYTTTENGVGITTNSTCENQPVPVMTEVVVNQGRPILRGIYSSDRAVALRVWINGQWYTLGIDPRLSTYGDAWELNLAELDLPLRPGNYTVVVEVETSDGLLLRNTNAGSFIVPIAPRQDVTLPPAKNPGRPNLFQPETIISTILPRTQEAARAPSLGQLPAMSHYERSRDVIGDAEDNTAIGVYVILFVGTIGGGAWFIKRWLSR